jgi:hypothetical protein
VGLQSVLEGWNEISVALRESSRKRNPQILPAEVKR